MRKADSTILSEALAGVAVVAIAKLTLAFFIGWLVLAPATDIGHGGRSGRWVESVWE
jgi:hypothetical protein